MEGDHPQTAVYLGEFTANSPRRFDVCRMIWLEHVRARDIHTHTHVQSLRCQFSVQQAPLRFRWEHRSAHHYSQQYSLVSKTPRDMLRKMLCIESLWHLSSEVGYCVEWRHLLQWKWSLALPIRQRPCSGLLWQRPVFSTRQLLGPICNRRLLQWSCGPSDSFETIGCTWKSSDITFKTKTTSKKSNADPITGLTRLRPAKANELWASLDLLPPFLFPERLQTRRIFEFVWPLAVWINHHLPLWLFNLFLQILFFQLVHRPEQLVLIHLLATSVFVCALKGHLWTTFSSSPSTERTCWQSTVSFCSRLCLLSSFVLWPLITYRTSYLHTTCYLLHLSGGNLFFLTKFTGRLKWTPLPPLFSCTICFCGDHG